MSLLLTYGLGFSGPATSPGTILINYTAEGLIESVRIRGLIPESSDNLDDDGLLLMMTEELQSAIAEILIQIDEEHYVTYEDFPVVAGQAAYDVPSRSIGGMVRDVRYASSSSPTDEDFYPLNRTEPENRNEYSDTLGSFIFQDGTVVLVPTPTVTGTLRISYLRRPNNLVTTDSCGRVTAIDSGTKTVTITPMPDTFDTDTTYDIIKKRSPYKSLGDSLSITALDSTTLTFTDDLPSGLGIGDYVCVAEQSPIPQCPADLHKLLVLRTRCAALDAIGDPRLQEVTVLSDKEFERALKLLTPRAKGRARTVINRQGPGFTRGPRYFRSR